MNKDVELVTAAECAERLGYSKRHFVERISKQPKFPRKIGKMYNWIDVLRFLAHG